MTTPSDREAEIEAVAEALGVLINYEGDRVFQLEHARAAVKALDSYRAENKIPPPYMQANGTQMFQSWNQDGTTTETIVQLYSFSENKTEQP